jgi:hypothetical protein
VWIFSSGAEVFIVTWPAISSQRVAGRGWLTEARSTSMATRKTHLDYIV